MDFRVGGKDLLDQGRARPRQTDHKDRSRIGINPATSASDEVRCERSNQLVDELRMLIGVAAQATRGFPGGLKRVGGSEMRGRLLVLSACIEDTGQPEMQQGAVAVG